MFRQALGKTLRDYFTHSTGGAMTTYLRLAFAFAVATLCYPGLAILGSGGFAAFFADPEFQSSSALGGRLLFEFL